MSNEKKVTLYFIRHGETQYNVEKRMQGFCDSPLTEKGIMQARSVGRSLTNTIFEAAYSSDSQRVLDTAKFAIGDRDIPLSIDTRLKEMNFGVFESLLQEEISSLYGDALKTLFSLDLHASAPEGESYSQLFERTENAIKDIVKKHSVKGGNILIFSHGVTIGNYIIQLTQSKKFTLHENCSVTIVSYLKGKSEIETIADTSFRENGQKYI
ncbi:putative phosphoglycerate mutase [Metabacillus crassostreae]|uniref:histidine phosphatase family protein n=1 Tax=Metabacillus crassostreae TaxID=929098 RepID=UPI001956D48A|nr:putative phosphoglycerate mutase [Metabacillus crassostreae]